MTDWIKCSDRLPEMWTPVQVYLPVQKEVVAANLGRYGTYGGREEDVKTEWRQASDYIDTNSLNSDVRLYYASLEPSHWKPMSEPPV